MAVSMEHLLTAQTQRQRDHQWLDKGLLHCSQTDLLQKPARPGQLQGVNRVKLAWCIALTPELTEIFHIFVVNYYPMV